MLDVTRGARHRFQSEYQQKPDFFALLAEHTYYLLPLVFDSALTESVGAPMVTGLASKAYYLLPMVVAFALQFFHSTGALTLPFMFQHNRVSCAPPNAFPTQTAKPTPKFRS